MHNTWRAFIRDIRTLRAPQHASCLPPSLRTPTLHIRGKHIRGKHIRAERIRGERGQRNTQPQTAALADRITPAHSATQTGHPLIATSISAHFPRDERPSAILNSPTAPASSHTQRSPRPEPLYRDAADTNATHSLRSPLLPMWTQQKHNPRAPPAQCPLPPPPIEPRPEASLTPPPHVNTAAAINRPPSQYLHGPLRCTNSWTTSSCASPHSPAAGVAGLSVLTKCCRFKIKKGAPAPHCPGPLGGQPLGTDSLATG